MKFLKNHKGTSLIEFVLILPVLIVILFGIIEFAIVLFDKAMINNASREGARAGVVYNVDSTGAYSPFNEADIQTIVNNYMAGHLINFSSDSAITTVVPSQCPDPGATGTRQIAVAVTYDYTFFLLPNFVAGLVGMNPLHLSAQSIMRCE
jgi:Flp pilus assembly protein TadG